MAVNISMVEKAITNKVPNNIKNNINPKLIVFFPNISSIFLIVIIIPFASLNAQTNNEKCCVPI